MGVLMLPAQAAALLVVPSPNTNLWQNGGPGPAALLRRLASMLAGVCVGVWAGAGGLIGASGAAHGALGASPASLARLWLEPRAARPRNARAAALAAARAARARSGAGAARGHRDRPGDGRDQRVRDPRGACLQALGFEKEELLRARGISFQDSTIALGLALGQGGALHGPALAGSVLTLLPARAGVGIGQRLRLRVAAETFRRVFSCGLLALGASLAIRSVIALN